MEDAAGALNFASVLSALGGLRESAVARRNQLVSLYAARPLPLNDPRTVTARHLKAVASTTRLQVDHLARDLTNPAWWTTRYHTADGTPIPELVVRDELADYEKMCRFTLTVAGQSLFEAGMRALTVGLDPERGAERARGSWMSQVARPLFGQLGEHVSCDPDPLLTLGVLSLVRNLQHNNGRYMPPRLSDVPSTWRSWSLGFADGETFAGAYWPMLIELFAELVEVNWQVMSSPPVLELADDALA